MSHRLGRLAISHFRLKPRPRTFTHLLPDVPCQACPGLLAVYRNGSRHHIGACAS